MEPDLLTMPPPERNVCDQFYACGNNIGNYIANLTSLLTTAKYHSSFVVLMYDMYLKGIEWQKNYLT